jgi:hypothetical protein
MQVVSVNDGLPRQAVWTAQREELCHIVAVKSHLQLVARHARLRHLQVEVDFPKMHSSASGLTRPSGVGALKVRRPGKETNCAGIERHAGDEIRRMRRLRSRFSRLDWLGQQQ